MLGLFVLAMFAAGVMIIVAPFAAVIMGIIQAIGGNKSKKS